VNRTLISLVVLLVTSLAANAQRAPLPDLRLARDTTLQAGLERTVYDLGLDGDIAAGRLSLALVDVSPDARPRLAMLNGDRMVYAASLPKIAILLGVLAESELGRLTLDTARLATLNDMIRLSSNDAASRALEWIGGARLAQILQSERFALYDASGSGGLWVGKGYGKEGAFGRDPLHQLSHGATAFQVARLYYLLANDALLSAPFNALMKDVLSRPGIHHKFVKGLDSRPGVQIFRKSGTWRDFHADSALVEFGDRRYVMVGLAQHAQGGQWLERLAPRLHDLIVTPGQVALAPAAP
jgi:beta-lactamase class A